MKQIAIVAAIMCVSGAGQALADERTGSIRVSPGAGEAVTNSCQMVFDISRNPAGSDRITMLRGSIGILLANNGARLGTIKVSAMRGGAMSAPDATAFVVDVSTTESEKFTRRPGDDSSFTLQGFNGAQTSRAFDLFRTTGRMQLAVRMSDADGSSIWTVDISDNAVARRQWADCLSKVRPNPAN